MRKPAIWILALLLMMCVAGPSAWSASSNGPTPSPTKKHSKKKAADSNNSADKSDQSGSKRKSSKVDLNTASKEELDALPGIGDAYAQKIMDGRPYKSKSDLVKKGVLSASAYSKIKDQVTARESKTSTSRAAETSKARESKGGGPEPTTNASKAAPDASASGSSNEGSMETAQTPPQAGMVWVNLDSGVYHREGDRWYGKTKHGKFMSEADAQKAGYRASKTGKNSH